MKTVVLEKGETLELTVELGKAIFNDKGDMIRDYRKKDAAFKFLAGVVVALTITLIALIIF